MSYSLGVDLGTTFVAAAVAHPTQVETFTLGDRSVVTPSVVYLREDGVVVTGEAANRRAVSNPDRVGREFKRRMGDPTPVILGGTPHAVTDLLGAVLRDVLALITATEGAQPERVVLTHPANWGPFRRGLFEQVPIIAGLEGAHLTTEPEAAAAHYAATRDLGDGEVVAVYDLGGGTFDATVLRNRADGVEILGTPEGIERLGGVDFDEAILNYVNYTSGGALSELDMRDPQTVIALARLRQDCVLAKEALSIDSETILPVFLPGRHFDVPIRRAEFEDLIRAPIESTIGALSRTLRSAGVSPDELSAVLLVGGSSRIPLVARMVSEELGRPTVVDTHPKYAVALGAATLARMAERSPQLAARPATGNPPAPPTTNGHGTNGHGHKRKERGAGEVAAAATGLLTGPRSEPPGDQPSDPPPSPTKAGSGSSSGPVNRSGTLPGKPLSSRPGAGPDTPGAPAPPSTDPSRGGTPRPSVPFASAAPSAPPARTPAPSRPADSRPVTDPPRPDHGRRPAADPSQPSQPLIPPGYDPYGYAARPPQGGTSQARPAQGGMSQGGMSQARPPEQPPPPYGAPPSGSGPAAAGAPAGGAPARGGLNWKVLGIGAAAVVLLAAVLAFVFQTVSSSGGTGTTTGGPTEIPQAQPEAPVVSRPIPSIGASIQVGATPGFAAASPNGSQVYIANRGAKVVTVVDTRVNQVTATIPVDAGPPQFLTFAPDGKRVYVSIFNPERTIAAIGVLDTASNKIIGTVPVRTRPFVASVTKDGKYLCVPNHDSGTLSVIDTASLTVVKEIKVAPNPHWVEFSVDGTRAYTANHESNLISVLDVATDAVIAEIPVGTSPHSLAVNPQRPLLANVNYDAATATFIDTNTNKVTATVPVGKNPQEISWSPDGRHAYVANVGDGTVSVLSADEARVTATLPTGRSPTSVAVLPNGRTAYVTNLDSGTLTMLDIGQ